MDEAEHYHEPSDHAARPAMEARFGRTQLNAWMYQQELKEAAAEGITVEQLRQRRRDEITAEIRRME